MASNLECTGDVFVTGGAGFIGSHIVELLVENGYDITIYDNLSTGNLSNIEHIHNSINFIEGDLLDADRLTTAMDGHEIVSHQAAQLEITTAMEEPQTDLEVNTSGSLNVFDAVVENDISKVLYASSACVYGQAKTTPQSEEHPTDPNWPYGVSKLAVDKYANIYSKTYDIPFVGLRYGITYGQREWYGRVMTVFLKRALNGKPPVVWGGEQVRDFVHVRDASRLHNLAVESDTTGHEIYNVGTGVATSIKELAKLVVESTNLDRDIVFEDIEPGEESKQVERDRLPQELEKMVLDPSKAKQKLDWEPQVNLREGLSLQYEWLKENRERWQNPSY
ncbi:MULTISPECIES: NAD-dependent epimerase/dehydratase family protein [Halorussus]|uniref:NAD-dependent epimerase/dehydratase family protein n=1 Tax=Halorussus TaxID=1070314 RepID=UPI000E217B45|nr:MULTISPECIES: NAD-dependent epimerase/dehydratase family protein [Halorussus]NHN60116.1 NAD-dependent epimerase/dehydratase family protein [Halorussus sp. JP-T4]